MMSSHGPGGLTGRQVGRPLARHCDELVRRGPRPEERAETLAGWRRDLARLLVREFAALLPGDRLAVEVGEPELQRGADLLGRIGPVAANALLRCGDAERTALLSFTSATAIALTDRSFGGDGDLPAEAPSELPRSAALMIDRAAAGVARALVRAGSDGGTDADVPDVSLPDADVIVRSDSAVRLKPFAPDAPCVAVTLTLSNAEGREWQALLCCAERVFAALLPGTGVRAAARARGAVPADGKGEPFAAIPLAVGGVLAEFELSLARLDRLAPGETIPLAVPGELPLRIGERTFAWGRLGTVGDSMAIRLTRLAAPPRPITPGIASEGDRA